jgi:ribosomal protein S21
MKVNVEVVRNANETSASLIRRFTKRVQGAGVLPRVRSLRYSQRPATKFGRKKKALKRIVRQEARAVLEKLGKISTEPKKRR